MKRNSTIRKKKTGGLFTDYVNTFLKVNQETSDWPEWCQSKNDKWRYIRDYHKKEGILLNYNNIKKNPGLRALAKLMLNSFWGKSGQRSNKPEIKYISEPAEYFDMLTSDHILLMGIYFVSDDGGNEISIQRRVRRRIRELGDYLGDLTDEVPDKRIVEFVTGGPKNYVYKIARPDKDGNTTICKVRGITLNYKNYLTINCDTIKDMVINNRDDVKTVRDDFKITRDHK
jgi:hypothetical protein